MVLGVTVNWIAVVVSAVVGFIVSWLWWGPLFGKQWIRYSGISPAQAKKMHKQGMGGKLLIAFIAQLIMAWVLAALLIMTGTIGYSAAAILAFWLWLGFVATIGVGIVLWNNNPWGLFWVNSIGWLVTLVLMAAALVMMG